MIAALALGFALFGAPQQHAEPPAAEAAGAQHAEAGHGEGEGVDFMHHILDSHEWETPFGVVHFPEAGSWMLGSIDITPTKHVLFLGFAALLTLALILSTAGLAKRAHSAGHGLPTKRRHSALEALILFLRDRVVMDNIGHDGAKFAPFIITLFFFILFANLLGLVPWGSTATANVAVTGGLALLTFLVTEIAGMLKLGPKGYLGTIFFVPPGMNKVAAWGMAVALSPIEMASKFTKPFALTIRLMANMTAGHIVLLALISLIFVFGSWWVVAPPVLMGVAITFLEIFVAFLQAYIFALLSAVFIGLLQHAH
jgi:F-type H+-transporting ATPase subunit a